MMVDSVVLDTALGGGSSWLVAGSVFAFTGIALVVTVERGPGMRAPGITVARHAFEVGITVVWTLAVVVAVWVSQADGTSVL